MISIWLNIRVFELGEMLLWLWSGAPNGVSDSRTKCIPKGVRKLLQQRDKRSLVLLMAFGFLHHLSELIFGGEYWR